MLTDRTSRPTALALAFLHAAKRLVDSPKDAPEETYELALTGIRSVKRGNGQVKERTTDARLSYRTAMKLKHQGIIE